VYTTFNPFSFRYYWPCGLIAQSFFNDEIKIPTQAGVLDEEVLYIQNRLYI
jgi:hypothetical protein